MEYKVGDRVKWGGSTACVGEVVRVESGSVWVNWRGIGTRYAYSLDDPYLTRDLAGDAVKAVLSQSPPKEPPAAPVEPRPCQRHYYGFKDERCTCQRGCASSV